MSAVITRILTGPPDLDPLTGDLRGIIADCLAKDPGSLPSPGDLLVCFSDRGTHDPTVTAAPTPAPPLCNEVLTSTGAQSQLLQEGSHRFWVVGESGHPNDAISGVAVPEQRAAAIDSTQESIGLLARIASYIEIKPSVFGVAIDLKAILRDISERHH